MKSMKPIAAAALLMTPAASPAAMPCVTQAEAADLVVVLLPTVLRAATGKCRSALPADAFLTNGGAAYLERLEGLREESWAGARRAMDKISDKPFPEGASAQTIVSAAEDLIRSRMKIKSRSCADVDRVVSLLAPLPPENVGALLALAGSFATNDRKRRALKPPICPSSGR